MIEKSTITTITVLYEHFTISGEKIVKHPHLSPIDTNCVILKIKKSAINEIFIFHKKKSRSFLFIIHASVYTHKKIELLLISSNF